MSTQRAVVIFPRFKKNSREKLVALGHVSMFKGPFKKLKKPFLNGIGGKIEDGETPEEAALREFSEEVTIGETLLGKRDFLEIGIVRITFMPSRKKVHLHVFSMYFPNEVKLTPSKNHPEFDSFAWYPLREISYPNIGPGGASLLPSDKMWLPTFLGSKGYHRARLVLNDQFGVYEIGEGDTYRSSSSYITRPTLTKKDPRE